MSSYCLGSGRAYGFELEIAKQSSPSPARSSSPSSTVSESSNAPRAVSFKKARAPRKRPNQTYNEAAALLATVYPTVFFSAAKVTEHVPFAAFSEPDDLLPPLPVLSDAAFLIHKPRPENHIADGDACFERKYRAPPPDWECASPASNVSWELTPLDPFDDDFDAESILDEEIGGGIDSIIGDSAAKSSADGDNDSGPSRSNSCMNPLLRSLIGHNLGAKFHLGLGFMRNFRRALRNSDDSEWWRSPAVPVRDINPNFKPPAALPPGMTPDKKKKKKMHKADEAAATAIPANSASTPSPAKLKASLGLKLSHEDVLRSWSGRGSIFSDGPDSPNSASDALARLADIDLFLDAGGVREASVLRYKEKRRTRLFAKKIRYEVRKTNADQRPRMKGRFVRRRPFEAIEEESQ